MWLLALLTACDTPDACPQGSVFSPHFGQCIGSEEASATEPSVTESSATESSATADSDPTPSTADTGR